MHLCLRCCGVCISRWFTPEARSVIDRILVPDPKQRLTLSQMKVRYTAINRILLNITSIILLFRVTPRYGYYGINV